MLLEQKMRSASVARTYHQIDQERRADRSGRIPPPAIRVLTVFVIAGDAIAEDRPA